VCGYDSLEAPAYDSRGCASFEICPSCGTEFGYDDVSKEHARLRTEWKRKGMCWWSRSTSPPEKWDALRQLKDAGFSD